MLNDKLKLFSAYYNKLYKSQEPMEEQFKEFFMPINLPALAEEHKQILDKEFTFSEFEQALQQMKLGRLMELDGISARFYITFRAELIPHMQVLF